MVWESFQDVILGFDFLINILKETNELNWLLRDTGQWFKLLLSFLSKKKHSLNYSVFNVSKRVKKINKKSFYLLNLAKLQRPWNVSINKAPQATELHYTWGIYWNNICWLSHPPVLENYCLLIEPGGKTTPEFRILMDTVHRSFLWCLLASKVLHISITTHDYCISCAWKAVRINICEVQWPRQLQSIKLSLDLFDLDE